MGRESRAPRWACALLARLAGPGRADEVVGDLEEAHRRRLDRHGRLTASLLTGLEALEMAFALLRHPPRSGPEHGARRSERIGRPPRRLPISWLDVKLGFRLLVKHPTMALVSTVGLAVGVTIGASTFGVIHGMTSSPLPLDEGDRVVTIQNLSVFDQARSTHLHDLETWRREVPALSDLGAYRIVTRNLVTPDGAVSPARVVEMTASGFRIARVPPLLGRHFVDADEREGAADVVVIGHGVWQDRFGGSPDVVGRSLQVGATRHTVVGVMPEGFAFPINNRVWTPFRLDPLDFEAGRAPPIDVFGRLAPGATLDEASAQLDVLGRRAAAREPEIRKNLRTVAFPFTLELVGEVMAWALYLVEALVSLLLVVIAVNVATLVYARTVARAGEIAVRTALGASRGRIAAQLFVEAFLLSSVAAALGLVAAGAVLERIELYVRGSMGEQAPFWWDFGLSPGALVYAFGLAVVAAVIIGVVPALGATGRRLRAHIQRVGSGAVPRLGRIWTGLIVAQIALAVAILPVGLGVAVKWAGARGAESSFPVDEVLVAHLVLDGDAGDPDADGADPLTRYAAVRDEVTRRFEALPEVSHVAAMVTAPWEDPDRRFEMDRPTAAPLATPMQSASTGHRVGRSRVSPEFFAAFDVPVEAGRALDARDAASEAPPVVVNRTFVELVTAGESPLGRRIRFPDPADPENMADAPWHTIVGVVPNVMPSALANPEARAYLPVPADVAGPVSLAVRVRDADAGGVAGRLRQVAAEIDPMLRLAGLDSVDAIFRRGRAFARLFVFTIAALSLSTLLLAVAGLYALMSFTVARRHREIGIRTALGAQPHRVISGILTRAGWQLGVGIAVGLALAVLLNRMAGGEMIAGEVLILPVVALLMAGVGILAAWGPARRGLRIQPSEALKAE